MPDRIVVGIDGSTPSRAAVLWSAARAAATGSTLTLIHVAGDHAIDETSDATDSIDAASDLLQTEIRVVRGVAPGVEVRGELVQGEAFTGLADAARDADLLVIGTHKTGFIQGRSIGSRFLDLASAVAHPIAVIPSVPLTTRRGIVVAVDLTETGRRAIDVAADDADRTSQHLTLLFHVDSRRLGEITDEVRSAHPRVGVSGRLAQRGISRELIDASMVATLVVIAHPTSGGSAGSESSVAVRDILLNLAGPTMVIPRSGRESSPVDSAAPGAPAAQAERPARVF